MSQNVSQAVTLIGNEGKLLVIVGAVNVMREEELRSIEPGQVKHVFRNHLHYGVSEEIDG